MTSGVLSTTKAEGDTRSWSISDCCPGELGLDAGKASAMVQNGHRESEEGMSIVRLAGHLQWEDWVRYCAGRIVSDDKY